MSSFLVTWSKQIEAPTASAAAFLAYKAQHEQSAANVRYSVGFGLETLTDVTIAKTAPLELLTSRENSVAKLVMLGASNADIGSELGITPRTVKSHVSHIFEKFHVNNRVTLATSLLRMTRDESEGFDASI